MEYVELGRTGLSVSVAGLGCGGHSRLGMATGHDEQHAADIVRHALDLGINFIDTAHAYGTERAVGQAIGGRRDEVVLSTKAIVGFGEQWIDGTALTASVEESLGNLGTDHIDVFHLHGVRPAQVEHCVTELVPTLERLQSAGKIRFLGITETFARDPGHEMFAATLPRDLFDVVMVGFNLLNPSARQRVFPQTLEARVGTLIMFAVRRALSRADALEEILTVLVAGGQVDADNLSAGDALGFLSDCAESVVEAAYRFCRHEPGADVILTGTGSAAHLRDNVAAILAPPLPSEVQARLSVMFGAVDSVSGN